MTRCYEDVLNDYHVYVPWYLDGTSNDSTVLSVSDKRDVCRMVSPAFVLPGYMVSSLKIRHGNDRERRGSKHTAVVINGSKHIC